MSTCPTQNNKNYLKIMVNTCNELGKVLSNKCISKTIPEFYFLFVIKTEVLKHLRKTSRNKESSFK